MEIKWFEEWFDTPYYHILYKNRDNDEAALFIDNLFKHIHPKQSDKLLDIACGRGRHAKYMSEKGFDTTGIDLSEASIAFAKQFENENLHFEVHDMRQKYSSNYFDIAFNLFTSFGYFQTKNEHLDALKSFNETLQPHGLLVLDYFNSTKIINDLIPLEIKKEDGISFKISKRFEDQKIYKTIEFEDNNQHYKFVEEVFAFSYQDFQEMLKLSNFTITEVFGDYTFKEFHQSESPRLILICKKNDARIPN